VTGISRTAPGAASAPLPGIAEKSRPTSDVAGPNSVPTASDSDPAGLGSVLLRPLRAHAFQTCVERLAAAIQLGVFPTGTLLPPERELAGRLGVSRATLREAIAALRSAGMVVTARGRGGGTTVDYRPPEPGPLRSGWLAERRPDLIEALQFRRIVEPGACYVAAGRALGPVERERLVGFQQAVRQATDSAALRQADSRLHLAIAAASGSAMVIDAVTDVQTSLHEILLAIPVLGRTIEHSNHQHATIVSAILAGNPAAARRAMEQHCDDTAALLRGPLGLPPDEPDSVPAITPRQQPARPPPAGCPPESTTARAGRTSSPQP